MEKLAKCIRKINETAREDFVKAQGMLEILNDVYGLKMGWLNKRVVYFEDQSLKYSAPVHDALMYLESTWNVRGD